MAERIYRNLKHLGGNCYSVALCDSLGCPLVYYKAYYNYKSQTYSCYPEKIAVAGSYELGKIVLNDFDFKK